MSGDRPDQQDGPDSWLSGLSDKELHEIALSGDDIAAAFATARLRWFAESHSYRFGWFLDDTGDYAIDAAWVAAPPRSVAVVGPPDAADDMVELTPLGEPGTLTGIRATWYVYADGELQANLAVRTADGREWRLTPQHNGTFAADLPADLARLIDVEGPAYEVDIDVTVVPRADELAAVEDIDALVDGWADGLSNALGLALNGATLKPLAVAAASPGTERTAHESSLDLPSDVAERLGVYPRVSWRVDEDGLTVFVVPDPDSPADRSARIVVAAVDDTGEIVAVGQLDRGSTIHTCRLEVGDPGRVSKVVVSELVDE